MDLKQIKELMSTMERAGIKKLIIKQKGGDEVHLERQDDPAPALPHPHPVATFYPHAHPHHPPLPVREAEPAVEGKAITAPLVGTVYLSPSPGDPHFMKVGDRVSENTVVCIIEAMKVMNEVKAGMSGVVAEVLVENAHPVEFGTKLFRIV